MSGFALSQTTLLLFQLGATALDSQMPDDRGTIPGHGPSQDILNLLLSGSDAGGSSHPRANRVDIPGRLNQHFCLAVAAPEDVQVWETWLEAKDVQILGKVNWPRGGKSVYFADLDGNVGEIASRGIWEHY
ncbi:lactoylglutathione lyase-like lyase [Cladophialophora carrionii]|uniref:Lactoylglutathione lyase-like lyase n=1 Tax=Cladophialophora carrionii TaxID=86049 RepID=A0A1C1C8M4_9EURO|nr:lactoylglutathione lyase-like lyase [Cladophialophora carrionii]